MAAPTSSAVSLKDYLRRYESHSDEADKSRRKKKKEKQKPRFIGGGVLVVDEDPVWQKPVQLDDAEEERSISIDETPQIEEDIEVKRMRRLEWLRSVKPYHGINDDGSGWISIPNSASSQDHVSQRNSDDSRNTEHFSSKKEKGVDLSSNLSPPRLSRRRLDTPSPEPRLSRLEGETIDLSPPRRQRAQDLSPPRRGRSSLKDDLSPPRKPKNESSKDLSPPRKARFSPPADRSLPTRAGKRFSDDSSPPRSATKLSKESTHAKISSFSGNSHTIRSHENSLEFFRARLESSEGSRNIDLSITRPLPSFTEVRKGGMLSGREMREETERKRMEDKARFDSMDPLLTGRGAEVVYRDKEGRRVSKEELVESKEQKKEEKPLEWGKGLAQKREAEEKRKELKLETERPFARTRDDPELDTMLKERIRWGDPMAHLVKPIIEDLGEIDKMKEFGFIIPQSIPSHSWLKRGLDYHPNRYNIRPGRHWDGVDRSNGYEKELFKRRNEKQATETEAYLWSVSDM